MTIAFIFTVIDSFAKLGQDISDSVQSVGLIWLWLLPIVVGWLLYPVCARSKLVYTLKQANKSAYVADSVSDPVLASSRKSELQAISVSPRSGAVYRDEKKIRRYSITHVSGVGRMRLERWLKRLRMLLTGTWRTMGGNRSCE